MSSWDDWADGLTWEGEEAGKPKETPDVVDSVTQAYETDDEKYIAIAKAALAEAEEEEGWKKLRLLYAFPISIVISLVLIIVFNFAGAKEDELLEEIEILLVTFSICLTGILTRSKKRSLINIFVIPIVYFVPSLLNFHNPYTYFDNFGKEKIPDLLDAIHMYSDIDTEAFSEFTDLGYVLDLLFLFVGVFLLGFFLAMIATGLRKEDGEISKISLISKPIAIFFVILLLFIPIAYLGIARFADGTVMLGISAMHAKGGFDALTDSRGIDKENVTTEFDEAATWMEEARKSYVAVGENLGIQLIFIGVTQSGILGKGGDAKGMYEASLDFMEGAFYCFKALPKLVDGFIDLEDGMNITLEAIDIDVDLRRSFSQSNDSEIDYESFQEGLAKIQSGIVEFENVESEIDTAISKVLEGIEGIMDNAGNLDFVNELDIVATNISSFRDGIPIVIDVAKAAVPFLNATYWLNSAREYLDDNNFTSAINYLRNASTNLNDAVNLLNIATDKMNQQNTTLPDPIPQIVHAITDVSAVISYLTDGGIALVDMFTSLETVAEILADADLTDLDDPYYIHSPSNLTAAENHIDLALANVTAAKMRVEQNRSSDYSSFEDTVSGVFDQLSDMIDAIEGNLTDASLLIDGQKSGNNAFINFGHASTQYNESLQYAGSYNITEIFDATGFIVAKRLYNSSYYNASAAKEYARNTTTLNTDIKSNLLDSLDALQSAAILGMNGCDIFIPRDGQNYTTQEEFDNELGNATEYWEQAMNDSELAQYYMDLLFGNDTNGNRTHTPAFILYPPINKCFPPIQIIEDDYASKVKLRIEILPMNNTWLILVIASLSGILSILIHQKRKKKKD